MVSTGFSGRPMKICTPGGKKGHFIRRDQKYRNPANGDVVKTYCNRMFTVDFNERMLTPHLHAIKQTCEPCYQNHVKETGVVPY